MRKAIIILVITIFLVCACFGLENPSIEIGNEKISLCYSTKADVERLLGIPGRTEYFNHGGEDFHWENFTVAFYDKDELWFCYNQKDVVIRISVSAAYFKKIAVWERDIKTITKADIEKTVKNLKQSDVFAKQKSILFWVKRNENNEICYGFWFDDAGKLEWMDISWNTLLE
jgi:hypothetical protein